jgi:hypothetical protein
MRRPHIFVLKEGIFAVSAAIFSFFRFDLSSRFAEIGHLISALIVCIGMKNMVSHSANLDRARSVYIFNPLVCFWPTVLAKLDQESSPTHGAMHQPVQNERLSTAQAYDGALDRIPRLAPGTLTFSALFKSLNRVTVSPTSFLHSQRILKAQAGVEHGRLADGIYGLKS